MSDKPGKTAQSRALSEALRILEGRKVEFNIKIPQTDDELWDATLKYCGIRIPRIKVCEHHCAPFTAFADAYFARSSTAIWEASRGFGGKTIMLAALAYMEAITLGAYVTLLGGSGEQSKRVHSYMRGDDPNVPDTFWGAHLAPVDLLYEDPTSMRTKLANGGAIIALAASQKSVRGAHPQRLRCLAGNTKILMQDGSEKEIKNVNVGDKIISYRAGQARGDVVQYTKHSGTKETVILFLDNGNFIQCTPDHKFLTMDGKWKEANDLLQKVQDRDAAVDANGKSVRVLSIKRGSSIPVFDITVKNANNFIAEGVVTHNCDEIDEMDLAVLDAALGQPMENRGIKEHTVLSSTHQNPDGTMTEAKRRAPGNDWKIFEWCYKESLTPHGWLSPSSVERKKKDITAQMWCFPPGQLVISENGIPEVIESVQGNVITDQGVARKINKRFDRKGKENLIKIDVQGLPNQILVTPGHKIKTVDGWKRAHQLKKNDRLIQPKRELKAGGNYADGWLVGLYLAEGFSRKGTSNRIGFALHENETSEVSDILNDWLSKHQYKHTAPGFAPKGFSVKKTKGSKGAIVSISHKILRNLISNWVNLKNTARTKKLQRLPREKNFSYGLLDGWLYGDGCAAGNGWVGSTTSYGLAWQMFQLATDLGYSVGLGNYKQAEESFGHEDYWHVRISNFRKGWNRDSKTIAKAVDRYKSGEPTRSIAKDLRVGRNNIQKWATLPEPEYHHTQNMKLDKAVGRRIRSVRTVPYSGALYDLEVEKDHTYLVSGIVVSNSVEYENQEPSPESRAILPDAIEAMFEGDIINVMPSENKIFEPRMAICQNKECKHEFAWTDYEWFEEMEREGLKPLKIKKYNPCPECGGLKMKSGLYATGADWARKRDWTVVLTFRTDCDPIRLVAFYRTQRQGWPVMIEALDKQIEHYDSYATHDATGLGDVVADYIRNPVEDILMVGRTRKDMLSNFIASIERGEIKAPKIEFMYNQFKYASVDDIFGTGHLPDSLSAGALAYLCFDYSGSLIIGI